MYQALVEARHQRGAIDLKPLKVSLCLMKWGESNGLSLLFVMMRIKSLKNV